MERYQLPNRNSERRERREWQAVFKDIIAENCSEWKTLNQKDIWVPSIEIRMNPYLDTW